MINQEVLDFIRGVKQDKANAFNKIKIGQIDNAYDDKGVNYKGSNVFLISYDINHIFKTHGRNVGEENRGQIPVVETDFVILKNIIPEIKKFIYKGQTRLRLDLILTKHVDGVVYYFTFEVRPKYRDLILKTMYKRSK